MGGWEVVRGKTHEIETIEMIGGIERKEGVRGLVVVVGMTTIQVGDIRQLETSRKR